MAAQARYPKGSTASQSTPGFPNDSPPPASGQPRRAEHDPDRHHRTVELLRGRHVLIVMQFFLILADPGPILLRVSQAVQKPEHWRRASSSPSWVPADTW